MLSRTVIGCIIFLTVLLSACSDLLNPDKDDVPVIHLIEKFPEFDFTEIKKDTFTIDTAYVKGKNIYLDISYPGGCKKHYFDLYVTGPFSQSNPPGCDVFLSHNSNGDTCTEILTKHLKYDLSPLDIYDVDRMFLFVRPYQTILYEKP